MIRKLILGNNFPMILLHAQKHSLGARLIEPNGAIGAIDIKWNSENKILQRTVSKVMSAHEEISFADSGLTKSTRRQNMSKTHWNEGWMEDV